MEGKQFDEALVERLATELLAASYSHRLPGSELEARKLSHPQEFEGFMADVADILSSLSSTHVILPKEEYERLHKVLRAAAVARTRGAFRKTCVTLSRKDFARLEVAVADWEVHAGLGYSAKDLEEASPCS